MLLKARRNAAESDFQNVECRPGEIEHLPLADASVDVIISNCVINLSPDKAQVFRETYRVLPPGPAAQSSRICASEALRLLIRSNRMDSFKAATVRFSSESSIGKKQSRAPAGGHWASLRAASRWRYNPNTPEVAPSSFTPHGCLEGKTTDCRSSGQRIGRMFDARRTDAKFGKNFSGNTDEKLEARLTEASVYVRVSRSPRLIPAILCNF